MKNIIMLHDVDGRIYFHALDYLLHQKKIDRVDYYETRITKRVLKCFIRREGDYFRVLGKWWANFKFRLSVPFLKDKNIIIGTAPYDFRFIWYGLLARKNKVIYHTSWPYWWTENVPYKYPPLTKLISVIFKYYLNNYNFEIVCVTDPVKENITKKLKDSISAHVIPHAVDLSLFEFDENKIKNDKVNVLYVGRMVSHKGIFELISVAKKLKDTHFFTLVGKGDDLNDAIKLAEGTDNIVFHQHESDRSKLASIFKRNDVFVLPSKKTNSWEELFGLVIIEAMACGLLVIATDHVGPRGLIKNSENGYLIKENNLEENIEIILKKIKQEDINFIGTNARQYVKNYNIENVSSLWLDKFNFFFGQGKNK